MHQYLNQGPSFHSFGEKPEVAGYSGFLPTLIHVVHQFLILSIAGRHWERYLPPHGNIRSSSYERSEAETLWMSISEKGAGLSGFCGLQILKLLRAWTGTKYNSMRIMPYNLMPYNLFILLLYYIYNNLFICSTILFGQWSPAQ